jgi:hypothetical protein
MGVMEDLYVGDARRIAAALYDAEGEASPSDLALVHLYLNGLSIPAIGETSNLDLMTACASRVMGAGPTSFKAASQQLLPGRKSNEEGAYLVADEWVRLAATLNWSHMLTISDHWFSDIQQTDPDFLEADGRGVWGLLLRLEEIVMACRVGLHTKKDVVYTWSL